jgi:hypothetical protein
MIDFPNVGKTKVLMIQVFILFYAPLRWSVSWISTDEPLAQVYGTQHSFAPVGRTQELREILAMVFCSGKLLFHLPNLRLSETGADLSQSGPSNGGSTRSNALRPSRSAMQAAR